MDRKVGHMSFRELLGFLLLTALLFLGLLSAWYLNRHQGDISRQLEDSAWLALSGQWENARQGAAAARERWEQRRSLWTVFADHTPMEEIDVLFAQLSIYAAAKDPAEFSAVCAALARHLDAMGEAHRLRWQNVL